MKILYEDNDIIVCVKPAGVATESASISSRDMVSQLKTYIVRSGKCKGRAPYLAVIHRLDQPVEGIMVFALNKKAAATLSRELLAGGFKKYYLAVVEGVPAKGHKLTDYIVIDKTGADIRFGDDKTPGASKCELEYEIAQTEMVNEKECTLVIIHLITGRFHQIRLQFAHMGNPLIGDRKHGISENSRPYTGNILLCSCKLSFTHPVTGKKMSYKITPSEMGFSQFDLEAALSSIM